MISHAGENIEYRARRNDRHAGKVESEQKRRSMCVWVRACLGVYEVCVKVACGLAGEGSCDCMDCFRTIFYFSAVNTGGFPLSEV